jgi:hypothetical protein
VTYRITAAIVYIVCTRRCSAGGGRAPRRTYIDSSLEIVVGITITLWGAKWVVGLAYSSLRCELPCLSPYPHVGVGVGVVESISAAAGAEELHCYS